VSGRRPGEGDRECVLDGQGTVCRVHFAWPNGDRLTRTYVNSRRVVRTRIVSTSLVHRSCCGTCGSCGWRRRNRRPVPLL
jgi:hypothetical protein